MPAVVEVRDLSVELGAVTVLHGVQLSVDPGEIVAVTGVNGSGKSTLLRCLSGLLRPSSGHISVCGGPPSGDPSFWRRVGLVAEEPAWYPGLTVREHLELVRITHDPVGGDWAGVDGVLDGFGLSGSADMTPLTLSAGQRQRLALAAALVRPSRLLLLDEPEQGLDGAFRDRLGELLADYALTGGTVVMTTHDPVLERRCRARRVSLPGGPPR